MSTDPNVPDEQVVPTPQQVLALPMQQPNDARAATVRDYLTTLLMALWEEGEGFSGKRPLGNSCWEWDLFIPLVRAGLISGTFETYEGEETGGLDECDDATGTQLISDAIKALSWPAEQPQDDGDVRAVAAFLGHFRGDPDDYVIEAVGNQLLTVGTLRRMVAALDVRDTADGGAQ